jgi:hypothetical protein
MGWAAGILLVTGSLCSAAAGTLDPVTYGLLILVGMVLVLVGGVLMVVHAVRQPMLWAPVEPWGSDEDGPS